EFSTDSTYLQPSSSDSDDSYVRTRKKYRNEWFVGLGNKECILDENANNWMVDDINISLILMNYRQSCIQKAEDDKMTNTSEVLSLNHIFLFEEDSKVGIRRVLDGNLIKKIFDEINAAFVQQLSDDDVLKCNKMVRTAAGTYKSCKTLLWEWQNKLNINGEQDFILEFFESMSSDTLAASKSRKKKFDPVLKGHKPDFVVSVSVGDKKENLLVTEVKPPKCRNIGLFDDKVKLGNELKDAIDLMINDQIISKDIIICGLLVDGKYFQGFICQIAINTTTLFTLSHLLRLPIHHDFGVFQRTIELLTQFKVIVNQTSEICIQSLRGLQDTRCTKHDGSTVLSEIVKNNESSSKSPPHERMTRSSYHSPIKIPLF
ncbi:7627_t:CDS:2, partial [Entrophospora sp. SA101]